MNHQRIVSNGNYFYDVTGEKEWNQGTHFDMRFDDHTDTALLIHGDDVRALQKLRTVPGTEKLSIVAIQRFVMFTINHYEASNFERNQIVDGERVPMHEPGRLKIMLFLINCLDQNTDGVLRRRPQF